MVQSLIPKTRFLGRAEGMYKFTDFTVILPFLIPNVGIFFLRMCPGRHFALRTLFLNILRTLATFDIHPPAGHALGVKFHKVIVRCVALPL